MATTPTSVTTRKSSKNQPSKGLSDTPPPSITLQEFRKLLVESEERVLAKVSEKFDALIAKVSALEASIEQIKVVQVSQQTELATIKDVIATQQRKIEAYEERENKCNLIFSNLPEVSVSFEQETLGDDGAKVLALANDILPPEHRLDTDDIVEAVRLGRPGKNPRIVKVKFDDENTAINILRSCRNLRSDKIRMSFGSVFINRDLPFLRRQEEKRLRIKRKDLKTRHPDADIRIKNGKLYVGPAIKDQVDYKNQLF